MRAVVVRATGDESVLQVEQVARPEPGPRDVLVRVAACGVCTLDLVTRAGIYRHGVELPFVPGHEIAGTVVATGGEVRGFAVGDRVASTQRFHICGACRYCRGGYEPLCGERRFLGQHGGRGGYAEYVAIEDDNLARVPPAVGDAAAAICACAIGTSLNAVRDVGRVRLGERVLVTGAGGGLGVHALQLARLAGAHVIAQTGSADKAALLAELGASDVLVTARGEDWAARVQALTGGAGVDVVIDNVGTPLFTPTRRSLAVNGRWVLVGQISGGFVDFSPAQLFLRNQSMLSVHSTTRAQLEDVLSLVAAGAIRPVVAGSCTFEELPEVHRRMAAGGVTGRIVVEPGKGAS